MLAATNISEKTQLAKFAKYNSTPKFVDLQYVRLDYINSELMLEPVFVQAGIDKM